MEVSFAQCSFYISLCVFVHVCYMLPFHLSSLHLSHPSSSSTSSTSFHHFIDMYISQNHSLNHFNHRYTLTHSMLQWFLPLAIINDIFVEWICFVFLQFRWYFPSNRLEKKIIIFIWETTKIFQMKLKYSVNEAPMKYHLRHSIKILSFKAHKHTDASIEFN